jgi:ectoine hydroxylase-related dioxygenase (phytanoyl-CoA dioxygenase family)
MNDLNKIITEKEGYKIYEGLIPRILITDLQKCLPNLKTVRAVSSDKVYAEREDISNLKDLIVFWSETIEKFPEFIAIKKIVDPIIKSNFFNLEFYAADIVTVNPSSTWINPHVDTPHRFDKWNYDKRFMGVQCIISLDKVTKDNAATGLVPYSQKRDFDIKKCYNGDYNRWFQDNCKQFDMPKGSLLVYNCRILHSSMPNNSNEPRPALLINYLDKSIIDEVSQIDNIWSSNGKRP